MCVLDMTGKRALADAGGAESERVLAAAHEAAVTLYQMGVKSESDLLALEPEWRDDWRGCNGGTAKQLLEFVSERQAGRSVGKRRNGSRAEPESVQDKLRRVYAEFDAGKVDIWQPS